MFTNSSEHLFWVTVFLDYVCVVLNLNKVFFAFSYMVGRLRVVCSVCTLTFKALSNYFSISEELLAYIVVCCEI